MKPNSKTVMLITCFIFMSLNALAVPEIRPTNESELLAKLTTLNDKTGVYEKDTYGNQTGEACQVEVKQYSDEIKVRLYPSDPSWPTEAIITPGMHINSKGVITTANDGGGRCGELDFTRNYQQQITVKDNEITISESYQCATDFFAKTEATATCKFGN